MSRLEWIELAEALVLHDRLLKLHGGAPGIRDPGLLESALARLRQRRAYDKSSVIDLAALLTVGIVGIVGNHPFVDGSRRTGFVLGVMFLELNGYRHSASEEGAAQAVMEVAAGGLDEKGYAAFLRRNVTREA